MLATTTTCTPWAAAATSDPRPSASLTDLELVRKIVEREGCIEALAQLVTSHARAASTHVHALTTTTGNGPKPTVVAATATLAAAPMVLQSLLEQLRGVTVQVIEGIAQWGVVQPLPGSVFTWRGLNYLLKICSDLDFLAAHGPSLAVLEGFRGLRLTRNPFLGPLHLDHPALCESTPAMACRLGLSVGHVDMRRVFAACQLLVCEEQQQQKREAPRETMAVTGAPNGCERDDHGGVPVAPTSTTKSRVHWSHREVTTTTPTPENLVAGTTPAPVDAHAARALDIELSRELVFQHEHDLGALREELVRLQRRLEDAAGQPDRRRELARRVAAMTHELQRRTGDLFHRRNELHRKEAVFRVESQQRRRHPRRRRQPQTQGQHGRSRMTDGEGAEFVDGREAADEGEGQESDEDEDLAFVHGGEAFQQALQEDELRRQELVEQFAAHAALRAATAQTRHRLAALAPISPSPGKRSPSVTGHASTGLQPVPLAKMPPSSAPVETWDAREVEGFIDALGLGAQQQQQQSRYGALLRTQGIDGALLAQATDSDLEELGIRLRLHRVKILAAVRDRRGGGRDGDDDDCGSLTPGGIDEVQ